MSLPCARPTASELGVRQAQPQGDPALRTDTGGPPAGAPEEEAGPFPRPAAPGAFGPSVCPAGTCPAGRQLSWTNRSPPPQVYSVDISIF